jgi:pilus assembly protein CpaC
MNQFTRRLLPLPLLLFPVAAMAQAVPALPTARQQQQGIQQAQMQPMPTAPMQNGAQAQVVPLGPIPLRLEAGTGRLVSLPMAASAVMAADPRIARVQPSSPTSVFVMAVANGRTTVVATNDAGRPVAEFDVTVHGGREENNAPRLILERPERAPSRPLNGAAIESAIRTQLSGPGRVSVRASGQTLVLSGTVSTANEARRIESIARGFANEDTRIVNELAVLNSIQVNIRVRVAEISRDMTRQFGFNWAAIGRAGNFLFGLRAGGGANLLQNAITGGLGAAGGTLAAPQRLGMAFRDGTNDINGIIDALASDNLITILAEPNLTAQSGEVASFLAGGEFPIPVAAGTSNNASVTIEFKSYGVSLAFVPIVLSNDRLTLRVRPEVSELTDQGAVNVPVAGGTLRIPALTVRRAETTLELGSGQSFAIAGLLGRSTIQGNDGVNGLTDIPVLGGLFRSDRFQRRETELVIIVTPYLVQPTSNPGMLAAPTDNFRPATSMERILYARQVAGQPGGLPQFLGGSAPAPAAAVPPGLGFRFE